MIIMGLYMNLCSIIVYIILVIALFKYKHQIQLNVVNFVYFFVMQKVTRNQNDSIVDNFYNGLVKYKSPYMCCGEHYV